ncbi:MAG: hypothetical protein KAI57_02370 [Candidatus Pacebacteria bacterium]|nr:hypothetical protein [Candidatus Paceibacterota bacterium]
MENGNENEKINNDENVSESSIVSETISDKAIKVLTDDISSNKDLQDAKVEKDEMERNPMKNISNNISAESNGIEKKIFSNKIESTFPSGKNKKKDLGLYIVGFILFLVLAGFVAYYFVFNDKDDNLEEDTSYSQQIIKSSFEAMGGVESYNFDGRVDVDMKIKNEIGEISENSIKINISGSEDESSEDYPKASYSFEMDSDFEVNQKRTSFFVDLSIMSFGKGEEAEIYMNLKELDYEVLESISEIQIDSFKNKWYELRIKDLKDMGLGVELFDTLDDSEESKFDIKDIYEKYSFFKFKDDLGDEKLRDIDVYHYSVEADSNELVDFYIDLYRTQGILAKEKEEMSSDNSSTEKLEEMVSKFEENYKYRDIIKDFVKQAEIEMWIGKNDNLIYKIKINLEMDEDFLKEMERRMDEIEDDSDDNSMNSSEEAIFYSINVELNMSEFNQSLVIEKPKDYENLFMVLMKSFMSGSSSLVDSDGDGLTDDMESVYGTDVNNPDTDGDGFNDGDEIDGGYDPSIPGAAKFNVDDFLGIK